MGQPDRTPGLGGQDASAARPADGRVSIGDLLTEMGAEFADRGEYSREFTASELVGLVVTTATERGVNLDLTKLTYDTTTEPGRVRIAGSAHATGTTIEFTDYVLGTLPVTDGDGAVVGSRITPRAAHSDFKISGLGNALAFNTINQALQSPTPTLRNALERQGAQFDRMSLAITREGNIRFSATPPVARRS